MPITTTSFTSVNVGTSANDGTGDELRIAFQKVNSNFSNISTVGFNSGNILASGNVQAVYFVGDGSQLTNIAASNAYANANVAAYLVGYTGIVTASNVFVSGNVTSQWFLGKANVSSIITTDLGASGMIYANAGVNSTSTGTGALVVNGGVGITGNLVVGNLTVLGTQTTVSATSVAVANSFVFLSNNNITNVLDIGFVGQYAAGQGNVYTGLVRRASDGVFRLFSNLNPIPSTTINVANITLATLQLGNILAGNVTGIINVAAQPYITSLGNLANLSSSGNITTTGYFFGNGSQLAGIVSYSNVFVATYLPTYSGNVANLTVTATLAGPTITAINSNVSVGNTNMKNYVDGQITAANSAVTAANLGMVGYVDNSVTTANTAMKGYVDAVADRSIYGNSNVKSYLTQFDGNLISNGNIAYNIGTNVNQWASVYANVIYANSNIYIGGTDIKSYIDSVASLSIYSNVNTKAYTESMGFQNYGNVNVTAYLSGNVTVGNISATYFTGNGSQLTGLPSGYSNVQVATYLPTYSGNIANVRLGSSGVLTFPDGTTQTTAASGGGSGSYGNANVTAYTVTMGFTNYSNVNVKAYAETMGYQNYGNVNVAALITTNGLTNYSNVNVIAYLAGNITAGNVSATYFTGNGSQLTGLPSSYSNVQTAAYLNATGYNLYSNVNVTAYLAGNITVGNLTVLGTQTTVNAQSVNLSNSFVFLSNNNITNAVDIGFVGQYNAGQGNVYTGLTYRAADGIYRLFSNVSPQPSLTVNLASAVYSTIQVGNIIAANVTVNTVIGSNVYVNGNVTATNVTTTNVSANLLSYGNTTVGAGLADPIVGTARSTGTRIVLYPANDNTGVDYAIGVSSGNVWTSVHDEARSFKWFANASAVATLSGGGNLSVTGAVNALGNILSTGASIFGNARLGLAGQVSGAFHTVVGNITQTSSGGAVYINTAGNLLVGGNLIIGSVGAVSGAYHTVVGNITQVTSGGAVGFNTTGNISASVANFGSGNVGGFAIGYRDLPQITAANLTLIAGDAGKHYYATNTSPTTLTIPLNSSVAFAIGTAVSVVNQGTGNITIAKGTTTLYLAGNSTSANRTITSYGMATLVKVATDTWFINGTGVV